MIEYVYRIDLIDIKFFEIRIPKIYNFGDLAEKEDYCLDSKKVDLK